MGSKILLADDSITIQKVVNLTFADEGVEVITVSNGEMAERRLAEINPDLVLADIFMPGKNGYELCQFVKESPQFRNVPVVLLVGAFEPFDQAEAKRVKADGHLTKPFESRTLVETVRKLIQTSKANRPAPPPPAPPPPAPKAREYSNAAIDLSSLDELPVKAVPPTRPLQPPFDFTARYSTGERAAPVIPAPPTPLSATVAEPWETVVSSSDPTPEFDLGGLDSPAFHEQPRPEYDLGLALGVNDPDIALVTPTADAVPIETSTLQVTDPSNFGFETVSPSVQTQQPEPQTVQPEVQNFGFELQPQAVDVAQPSGAMSFGLEQPNSFEPPPSSVVDLTPPSHDPDLTYASSNLPIEIQPPQIAFEPQSPQSPQGPYGFDAPSFDAPAEIAGVDHLAAVSEPVAPPAPAPIPIMLGEDDTAADTGFSYQSVADQSPAPMNLDLGSIGIESHTPSVVHEPPPPANEWIASANPAPLTAAETEWIASVGTDKPSHKNGTTAELIAPQEMPAAFALIAPEPELPATASAPELHSTSFGQLGNELPVDSSPSSGWEISSAIPEEPAGSSIAITSFEIQEPPAPLHENGNGAAAIFTPAAPTFTSDAPAFSPDVPAFTPEASTFSPDVPTFTPEASTPEASTYSADAPTFTPEISTFSADAPTFTPETSIYSPEVPTLTTDAPPFSPDGMTFSPEALAFTPDVPAFSPDAPTFAPDAPTPAAAVFTPEAVSFTPEAASFANEDDPLGDLLDSPDSGVQIQVSGSAATVSDLGAPLPSPPIPATPDNLGFNLVESAPAMESAHTQPSRADEVEIAQPATGSFSAQTPSAHWIQETVPTPIEEVAAPVETGFAYSEPVESKQDFDLMPEEFPASSPAAEASSDRVAGLPSSSFVPPPEQVQFTSSQLWADVQPEHPPLDPPARVQALPEPPPDQPQASNLEQAIPAPLAPEFGETGFEFSQLVEETEREQAAALELAATHAAESAHATYPVEPAPALQSPPVLEPEPQPEAPPALAASPSAAPYQTNGASSTALSQAIIEEIVRRVVQEMSDTVIREIAWEIVPDCVERVVEKLSREGLTGK
jgi:CheY-like chemotaxis protein